MRGFKKNLMRSFTIRIRVFWVGLFLVLYFSFSTSTSAQIQDEYKENFAFEVKQIDEFIERFNDEKTLIKEYVYQHYDNMEISREVLLKSLFNLNSKDLQKTDVLKFIQSVNNPQRPVLLSFYDRDWYARVKCSVLYQQKERELYVMLQVQRDKDGVAKWVINSVFADFFVTADEKDQAASLNPVSHGTDFMTLNKAFSDAENVKTFLPAGYQEDQLSKFILEVQNKRIFFQHVEEISYHFFQIDGWILTVENFQRQEKNSGWLISRLIEATKEEKDNYKQRVLKLRI